MSWMAVEPMRPRIGPSVSGKERPRVVGTRTSSWSTLDTSTGQSRHLGRHISGKRGDILIRHSAQGSGSTPSLVQYDVPCCGTNKSLAVVVVLPFYTRVVVGCGPVGETLNHGSWRLALTTVLPVKLVRNPGDFDMQVEEEEERGSKPNSSLEATTPSLSQHILIPCQRPCSLVNR
jgi:hypothetical protein